MKIIQKIKQKLGRCDNCWRKAEYHFTLPIIDYCGHHYTEDSEPCQYCYDHAITSGFCLYCGHFLAGIESFDFSRVKGFCSDCLDEIDQDQGIGECYGDMDYYDDYGHDFSEKQPQETMSSIVSSKEEENLNSKTEHKIVREMFKSSEG